MDEAEYAKAVVEMESGNFYGRYADNSMVCFEKVAKVIVYQSEKIEKLEEQIKTIASNEEMICVLLKELKERHNNEEV